MFLPQYAVLRMYYLEEIPVNQHALSTRIFSRKCTRTFSRKSFTQYFSRENIRSKIVKNGNTCSVNWSEPHVSVPYFRAPFLPDDLAVSLFLRIARGGRGRLRRAAASAWFRLEGLARGTWCSLRRGRPGLWLEHWPGLRLEHWPGRTA